MRIQNDLVNFLNNPEDIEGLNGLVEDIRYALIDYQVCAPKILTLIISDICLRLPYNKTCITRVVNRL